MLRKKSSFSSHSSSQAPSPLPGSRSSSSTGSHRHTHSHSHISHSNNISSSSSSSYSHHKDNHHHHHHHQQHNQTPTSGVRRALSSLQNALTPSRSSVTIERKKSSSTFSHQQQQQQQPPSHPTRHGDNNSGSNTSDSINLGITHADSSYSAHSNGTSDSFLSPSATMTPLTTTDDDSSTIASTHLHQQPRIPRSRQVSKNGSLASSITSPPSTYPHSDLSSQLNTLSLQNDAPVYPQHHRQSSSIYRGDDGKDSKMETSSIRSTKSGAVSISASTIASTAMTSPSAGNGDQLRVRHLEPGASHTGYLTKFSSRTFFSRKQWKRRYFVLNQRSLYCFKSSDPQHPLLETLNLCAETIVCVTDIFSGKRYCLQITSPGEKNWYVLADTANELSGWLRQLKGTVLRCRNPQQAMNQDPLYQYQQQQLESSRPRTHYSDSSEWSDLSSAASYGLMENGMHSSSVLPFTSSNNNHASSYLPNLSRSSSPSSTPPRRPPYPSERLDPYLITPVGGLNPHPRPMTPSFFPVTGPESTLVQEQGMRRHDDHRHHNFSNNAHDGNDNSINSISSGQLLSDYASFGAVMGRAETVSPETVIQGQPSSGEDIERTRFLSFPQGSSLLPPLHPLSWQQQRQPPQSPQKKKQQKRDSSLKDFSSDLDLFTHTEGGAIATRRGSSSSSTFSVNSGRRVSVVVDRPEAMITLPRRSSQRLMGSPSRPMSPVLSRPMSPNANRPSPRSSLVVAPPPRSIHRPASVSVRYSAQMISSLQIATQNLQQSIKTAEQHQRPMSPLDSPQRPGSRLSHLRFPSNVGLIHDRSPNGLGLGRVSMDRPLTPISATLASPPTSPLPEPPRPGSISPVRALRHSLSNSSSSSHRISIVPRHHDPDLLVSHRASPRSRAQSQESALVSRSHDKHFMQPQQQQQYNSHHASSPLPSFPGAIALDETSTDLDHDGQDAVLRKHISLPVSNKMALPPPPKIQQPDASAYHQYQHNTFPRQHKHSSSNASVSSMSSQTSSIHSFPAGVASFGGAIARKNNSRDSALSIRLSTLVPIPVGSVSSVPLPPQTALPPIPGSVVPSPSTSPLPTPPTSGKLEVVVPVSAGNEDGIATAAAALLAVPLSDLPTPPTSLTLALPTQLADVEEKEQQPCMTMPTAPAQDEATVENIVIDRQVDTVGVQSKVEPLSEEIVTPDAAAVEEEKEEERPHNPSWSMASEMILEEAEKADVSLIGAKDVVSVAASTTTATTTTVTTTTTNSTPTKDQLEEQEERQKEDVVASLAIESASPSLSS